MTKTQTVRKQPAKLINFTIVEQQQQQTPYEFVRNSYKNNDNIPVNIISAIVEHHFNKNIECIHKFTATSILYKTPVRELLKAPIFNWSQNREPDMVRIPDLASYINKNKKPLQTILYLSYKNKKDIFEIIDGIHRFSALKYIYDKNKSILNNSNIDFISDNTYEEFERDMNWLFDSYVIININFNATIGELVELRNSLNMTQPMPTVLMNDNEEIGSEKKVILEQIANNWQQQYPKNFSSSSDNSYMKSIGSTNRNNFIQLLDFIYKKYDININRINILNSILNEANFKMKELIENSCIGSVKARTRCKESGCYLFIYNNEKLEDLI